MFKGQLFFDYSMLSLGNLSEILRYAPELGDGHQLQNFARIETVIWLFMLNQFGNVTIVATVNEDIDLVSEVESFDWLISTTISVNDDCFTVTTVLTDEKMEFPIEPNLYSIQIGLREQSNRLDEPEDETPREELFLNLVTVSQVSPSTILKCPQYVSKPTSILESVEVSEPNHLC